MTKENPVCTIDSILEEARMLTPSTTVQGAKNVTPNDTILGICTKFERQLSGLYDKYYSEGLQMAKQITPSLITDMLADRKTGKKDGELPRILSQLDLVRLKVKLIKDIKWMEIVSRLPEAHDSPIIKIRKGWEIVKENDSVEEE